MDKARHQRVSDLFAQVYDLPVTERDAIFDTVDDPTLVTEVKRLLHQTDTDDMLSDEAMDEGRHLGDLPDDAPLEDIGGCRIIRRIGEGGMGVVYEAEQASPRRRVAVKLMKPGVAGRSMLRRFRLEGEVLGRLEHPGIARIYEVGRLSRSGSEQPYLVMEFVDGARLKQACDRLALEQVLELVARIADAVHHAHQKGVIHRDLKPDNVLVVDDDTHVTGALATPGQPKVLDFGIARPLDADLAVTTAGTDGHLIGTLAYMSPEQLAGSTDVDVRSDVYALGVIAYELLAGELPFKLEGVPITEVAWVVTETEPRRLGTIVQGAHGDVETIVARAMEKDASRRYQSAAELAADIRRYLNDEPILARPPSATYQLRKFARRHRALVGAGIAVVVVLIVGLIATGIALRLESAARSDAERELARSEASLGFLRQVLIGQGPRWAQGRDTTVLLEMLEQARSTVPQIEYAEVRAQMLALLGEVYANIYKYDQALDVLERAVAEYEALGSDHRRDDLRTRLLLGATLQKLGRLDDSAAIRLGVLTELETNFDDPHLLADALQQLSNLRIDQGMFESAASFAERALELSIEIDDPNLEAKSSLALGAATRRLGETERPEQAYLRAFDIFTAQERHQMEASTALNALAIIARHAGDLETAEQRYRESLRIRQELDPRPNPDVAASLYNLGRLLTQRDQLDEATTVLEASIAMHQEVFPDDYFGNGFPIVGLAYVASQAGDHERAEELYADAIEIWRSAHGDAHPVIATAWGELGDARMLADDPAGAEDAYRRALAIADELALPLEVYVVPMTLDLARALADQDRADEGVALLDALTPQVGAESAKAVETLRSDLLTGQ